MSSNDSKITSKSKLNSKSSTLVSSVKGQETQQKKYKKYDSQKPKSSTKEKYTNNMSSDEDNDDDDSTSSIMSDEDDYEENEIDMKEYRKLLSELFPSKYMKEKAKTTPPSKPQKQTQPQPKNEVKHESQTKVNTINHKGNKSSKPIIYTNKKAKKEKNEKELSEIELGSEDSDEYETYSDTDYSDEDYDEEEEEENVVTMNLLNRNDNPTKFNIIFTIGGGNEDEYYDEEDDDDYDIDEDDDSDYDDDSNTDEEEYEVEEKEKSISKSRSRSNGIQNNRKNTKDLSVDDNNEDNQNNDIVDDDQSFTNQEAFDKFNLMIEGLSATEKKNSVVKQMIIDIKEKEKLFKKEEDRKHKKHKIKNTKKFRGLLKEKNVMNDVKFFKENMTSKQQELVIKEIESIKKFSDVEKPYRLTLLESDIPTAFKACAYKKINTLKYMEPGAGEYYKIKNWVDTFMGIPFGKYKNLPLTIEDGVEKCHEFMGNAKQILDDAVYGLNDAKLQIMQMIGQLLVNPTSVGTAIAIKGPMGTGKTTLIKDGISKILGRDFAFIALGGATDSSFLEGHSYTYEGSSWGKIVDIIIRCKCMNPVIYFDELDKVSDTPRGEEIIGILTHLTDTTQNSKFHDKYFAEIDFDLSRCLFIFSYNDESKVNPILRDRMYRIHTKGYDQPQKTTISNNYLLPSIRKQVKFNESDIIIPDETIHYIITNHTDKEDGVRNLKRCLEIIHTKLNLYRLMKPDTNLFESDMSLKVVFPLTVTPEIVDKLIKKNSETGAWANMYS